jgi:hypothetical protein
MLIMWDVSNMSVEQKNNTSLTNVKKHELIEDIPFIERAQSSCS